MMMGFFCFLLTNDAFLGRFMGTMRVCSDEEYFRFDLVL